MEDGGWRDGGWTMIMRPEASNPMSSIKPAIFISIMLVGIVAADSRSRLFPKAGIRRDSATVTVNAFNKYHLKKTSKHK